MLDPGLYEKVINEELDKALENASTQSAITDSIDKAEASKLLTRYFSEVIEKGLDNIVDNGGDIQDQIELINKLVTTIQMETKQEEFSTLAVAKRAEQLLALVYKTDTIHAINPREVVRPVTSIAQSSLFTGAVHEPQMYSELKKEIKSCDRIDFLVSFIKWSGLRLIIEELREFTQKGGQLRVITTSYMGATDVKSVEVLRELPNTEVRISYDTKRTRLHAKAYIFYRNTGFTTCYVGSSNLSNVALSSGLEWNLKLTRKDQPETINKIDATFESYWNSTEFEMYTEEDQPRLAKALSSEKYFGRNDGNAYTVDVFPYNFQAEILDHLATEREVHGNFRNLVVAATGTGKTVISAIDYRRFVRNNPASPCRLLFVAHREELLKQSISTFRAVLKDANFGDLFVGNYRPDSLDHLFISIQTFNSQDFTEKTSSKFYDYIVVDEFHHAAAPSYNRLLTYYEPKILLGLTATPERMDGKSILSWFNDRIAAEIRLPEAIDQKLLSPFQYFGITDNVDLTDVTWGIGGYDKSELSNIYSMDEITASRRAALIVNSLVKYVTDVGEVKGLGFCVSIEHANFMSAYFNEFEIPAIALTGLSSAEERNSAKKRLQSGEIRLIFVVDIYNEGVDIPEINTIMFLRPTESLTIFLQQLGRGLRLAKDKECLTVLDFIGQANRRYNFEDKYAALLSNSTRSVEREIQAGFISLPKGCYIQLEKRATEYILENIRSSYGTAQRVVNRIARFEEDTGRLVTFENFLDYYHISPVSIYKYDSFSRLCARAEVIEGFNEPIEEVMKKALPRFAQVDSRRWIQFMLITLPILADLDIDQLSKVEKRMLQMFCVTMWQVTFTDWNSQDIRDKFYTLAESPILMSELLTLLRYNYNRIDFVDKQVDLGFDSPLDLHCSYSRDQLLVAMDYLTPSNIREGVKWLPEKELDVFMITLNKSDKDYSPTTMYNDYSINEYLFHWQSQSTTSESSPVGQRYINHVERGSRVLLFVREFKNDPIARLTQPYTFLGTSRYVSHEGSKPMNIVWKLDQPIPAKNLKKTNKLVVG